jgi:hypothetical protein
VCHFPPSRVPPKQRRGPWIWAVAVLQDMNTRTSRRRELYNVEHVGRIDSSLFDVAVHPMTMDPIVIHTWSYPLSNGLVTVSVDDQSERLSIFQRLPK